MVIVSGWFYGFFRRQSVFHFLVLAISVITDEDDRKNEEEGKSDSRI
jgi:hypothetical protein